jgi:hypothetical protein
VHTIRDDDEGANYDSGFMLGAVGGFVIRENHAGMTSNSWPRYCQAMAKFSSSRHSLKSTFGKGMQGTIRLGLVKQEAIILCKKLAQGKVCNTHLIIICLASQKWNSF